MMNDYFLLLVLPILTFLAAGMVKGVTGMGLPTVSMGLLGTVMPPAAAAAILVLPSFVTNVWQLVTGPGMARQLRRLWTMMLGIMLGTVGGSALLARVDARWSGLALGVALILYASYALASPRLSVPPRLEPWLSPAMGLVTGLITGATGTFVVPGVPYIQALDMDKDELVQALGLSFTVSTVALAIGLAAHGAFRPDQLGPSAVAVIPALMGMWLGQKVRARISPRRFRQCFLALMVLLGLELVLRALL